MELTNPEHETEQIRMFLRLGLGAGLIAATVVIQALFMSVGLRTTSSGSKTAAWGHGSQTRYHDNDLDPLLLIPIVLDVTLWSTFYYVEAHYRASRKSLFSTVTFTTVGYGASF